MTTQGQRQITFSDAAAVIPNADQLYAALLDFYINSAGTGIQSVFYQLFGNRCRALDYFTSSNLVGQARCQ